MHTYFYVLNLQDYKTSFLVGSNNSGKEWKSDVPELRKQLENAGFKVEEFTNTDLHIHITSNFVFINKPYNLPVYTEHYVTILKIFLYMFYFIPTYFFV